MSRPIGLVLIATTLYRKYSEDGNMILSDYWSLTKWICSWKMTDSIDQNIHSQPSTTEKACIWLQLLQSWSISVKTHQLWLGTNLQDDEWNSSRFLHSQPKLTLLKCFTKTVNALNTRSEASWEFKIELHLMGKS